MWQIEVSPWNFSWRNKSFFSGHFFFRPSDFRCWSQVCRCRLENETDFFLQRGGDREWRNQTLMGWRKESKLCCFFGFLLLLLQEIAFQNVTGFNVSIFLLCWLEMMLPFFLLCWRFIRTITQRIKRFFRSESLVQLAWRLILYPSLGHRMHSSWFCCFSVQHKRPYWGQTRVSNRLWIMNTEPIDSRNGKDFEVLEPSLSKYIDPLLKCK